MHKVTLRVAPAPDLLAELLGRLDALEQHSAPDDRWVAAAAVPTRFGISRRTLERWLRDPAIGFPQPIRINGRRFFSDAKLRRFKAKQEALNAKES